MEERYGGGTHAALNISQVQHVWTGQFYLGVYEFCIIESAPEPVTWVHCSALTALFLYASMRGAQKKVLELVTRNDDCSW